MTLPTYGAISLSQVNTELGLASTTTISMGNTNVRTLFGVPSGAISMSSGYGKSNRTSISYTFTGSTANASLNVATIGGYVAGRSDITVTVNSGVYLYATTTDGYALNLTGGTTGDTVTLVNNGYIMGQGGIGGAIYDSTFPPAGSGGPALNLGLSVSSITINTQSGYIGGGGGGGGVGSVIKSLCTGGGGAGGGVGGSQTFTTASPANYYAGGTGGGIGSSGGNGNVATAFNPTGGGGGRIMPGSTTSGGTVYTGNYVAGYGGSAGGSGGAGAVGTGITSTGGSGGGGGSTGGNGYSSGSIGSAGGGGGGWGASGGSGVANGAPADNPISFSGAAGGKAVNTNGFGITWTGGFNSGRVFGAVS